MNSTDQLNPLLLVDDCSSEISSSGRESVASSCYETELEVENELVRSPMDDSGRHDNYGRLPYLKACECLGVVPVKRFLDELRCNEMRVNHRNLGCSGSKAIAAALVVNNTITKLDLSHNMMGDKGALYIVSAIVSRDLIKVLVLSRNNFSKQSADVFAELLKCSKTLTVLNLSGNLFDDKDCIVISEALKYNKFLEDLDLSHNKLTEEAGVSLREVLIVNTTLQRLNLSWNLIRSPGMVAIATGISTNQHLKAVDVSWNGIDDLGIRALVNGLGTNSTLVEIQLSSNKISDKGLLDFVNVLDKSNLQSIDVSRNPFLGSNEAIEKLLKLLLNGAICLKSADIGQIPLTKESLNLLAELNETRTDIEIRYGYKREDSYNAIAPHNVNPCDILKDYAAMHQLHSFQFFRSLGESSASGFEETIPCDVFEIGLRKLKVFDDHQMREVINILDCDRNGVIDYSEFMMIFSTEKALTNKK